MGRESVPRSGRNVKTVKGKGFEDMCMDQSLYCSGSKLFDEGMEKDIYLKAKWRCLAMGYVAGRNGPCRLYKS